MGDAVVFIYICFFVGESSLNMLKNECPHDEVHRSCSFFEEYTCWQSEDRNSRVNSIPKRLPHCRSGCYCKNGLVRAYPHGFCILATSCRNQALKELLSRLPSSLLQF